MTTPTPAAVACPRVSSPAEAADEWPAPLNPGEGRTLPDEMPGADGTAFLLRFLPARLLWAPAVDAWLREDDGQPIKIGRDDLRAERARRLDERHEIEPEHRRSEQPELSGPVRPPGRRAAVARRRARRQDDRRARHEVDARTAAREAV